MLGTMGGLPFAGVAWQGLHYLEGFRRLGHQVVYVEDTGCWPYDPRRDAVTDDGRYALGWLASVLARCGLERRWAYVAPRGAARGPLGPALPGLFGEVDALVNLTGATVLRAEHLATPVRIYLETDPVLPQIEVAAGHRFTIELLAAHTHHFTFGENLDGPDCGVPATPFAYRPTRQPVVLDWWATADRAGPVRRPFTTVANWRQTGKDVAWNGQRYTWSKHHEFLKVLDLPRRVGVVLELALASSDREARARLRRHGWRVRDAVRLSRALDPYRSYLRRSAGEFTVAKDQNVRLRSGWFSDRSACYLAAGRPVVTQDTGFGKILPTGEGLFAFSTLEEAVAAFEALATDPDRHRRAARAIAREYFAAELVLARLLAAAGL